MRFALSFALAAFTLTACAAEEEFLAPPRSEEDAQPMWLWTGNYWDAAPCPYGHDVRWEGWAAEVLAPECGPCACGPAECVPPSGVTTHASTCPGEGLPNSFEADEVHNTACIVPRLPIPDISFASVTYHPPIFAPCAPSPTPEPPPMDGIFARACVAKQATETNPAGWSFCIAPERDGSCRPGFKIRREFTTRGPDHRTCAPCECGPPSGGSCSVMVTLYGDTSCTSPFDSTVVSDTDVPLCHDITATAELTAFRLNVIHRGEGACTPKRPVSMVYGVVEEGERHVACCHN